MTAIRTTKEEHRALRRAYDLSVAIHGKWTGYGHVLGAALGPVIRRMSKQARALGIDPDRVGAAPAATPRKPMVTEAVRDRDKTQSDPGICRD